MYTTIVMHYHLEIICKDNFRVALQKTSLDLDITPLYA